jgi:hypothetical protein
MIRVVNFACVALMGLAILGLYQISEKTRVARVELAKVDGDIAKEQEAIRVLETEWQRVAGLKRIQTLAAAKLGMSDTATRELAAFELLPRRGDTAPLPESDFRQASAQIPVVPAPKPQPGY